VSKVSRLVESLDIWISDLIKASISGGLYYTILYYTTGDYFMIFYIELKVERVFIEIRGY